MALEYVPYEGPVVTRAEAQSVGLVRFFTARLCKRGHLAERATVNGTCLVCLRERHRADDAKAWARTSYRNNRSRALEYARAYQEARRTERAKAARLGKGLRSAAKAGGATRYFTGIPCKFGHVSERHVSNGQCVQCTAGWQRRNRETCNRLTRAWVQRDLQHSRLIARVASHRRRIRLREAGGSFTAEDVSDLLQAQRRKCANPTCRKKLDKAFEVDHITPVARGGTNARRNLQLLCPPCNRSKNAKDPIAWAQSNGLLL